MEHAIEHKNHSFIYITTPSGFAKSTNLDMLRRFLEIPIDNTTGRPIKNTTSLPTSENYRLFANASLNLKILNERTLVSWGRYEKYIDVHFGQYPVIFLNFRYIAGTTYDQMLYHLSHMLRELYVKHDWLYESQKANLSKFNDFQLDFYDIVARGNAHESEIQLSLRFLCLLLSDYFDEHVVLLIDDFDAPIINAMSAGISIDEIYSLVHDMINTLQVEGLPKKIYAVFTGSSRLFVHLNNTRRVSFLELNEFYEDFGLTEIEVKAFYNEPNTYHLVKKLKKFSAGYTNHEYSAIELYNPRDVTYHLEHQTLLDTPPPTYLTALFTYFLKIRQVREKIVTLFFNKTADIQFTAITSFDQLRSFYDTTRSPITNRSNNDTESFIFFSYLMDSGFLTYKPTTETNCQIPNDKVIAQIKHHISNYYATYGVNFIEPSVVARFHSIIRYKNTTTYVLKRFQSSLNKLFELARKNRYQIFDPFEFSTIIRSIALYNFHPVRVNAQVKKLRFTNKSFRNGTDDRLSLVIAHRHATRQVVILFDVSFHRNVTQTIQRLVQYVPNADIVNFIVKYLVINMNEDNMVQVRDAPNFFTSVIEGVGAGHGMCYRI